MEAGALQDMVIDPSPADEVMAVGTPGTVAGVTAFEAADAVPVPTEFTAATVNV